jgi:hypothetical protein
MIYSDIEKYLNEDNMDGLLDELAPVFLEVQSLTDSFIDSSIYNSGDAIKASLSKLTSYYSTLKVASIVIDTFKKQKETRKFNEIKMATENAGGKFTATSGEKEASAFVDAERRVRNIIDAYIDIADKGITISQSILKYISEEIRMTRGQTNQ